MHIHPRLAEVNIRMEPTVENDLMTASEVAAKFRVSVRTLTRRLQDGTLPIEPSGVSRHKLLFIRADVEKYLTGQRRMPRPAA